MSLNRSLILGSAVVTLAISSCGSPETPAPETAPPAATATGTADYEIDTTTSTVGWKGSMGPKSHTGTLHFVNGDLRTDEGKLTGGSFAVNMHSYAFTDTNYAKPGSAQGTQQNLMGHLMSSEFFAVDSFPTSEFIITKVEGSTATGNLTVRGRTNTEEVRNIVLITDGKAISASGELTFNRQKYGVSWKSSMKDMVLSDDIVLRIKLQGTAR